MTLFQYHFMINALAAVLLSAPLFAGIGALVVNNRMTFFSDVIGHSALTGVAIGLLFGLADPQWVMLIFAAILALSITVVRKLSGASSDMILGVFFALIVAIGIVILSAKGNFPRYSRYLIGDILAVSTDQLIVLAALLGISTAYILSNLNMLLLTGINPAFARSRGVSPFVTEALFAVLTAVVVTVSIRLVGILVINSLLILPAAAARNVARNFRSYIVIAVVISLLSGITGLIVSYGIGSASGATIVLFAAVVYAVTLPVKLLKKGG